ncbi:MAG: carbohydrate kinase family protein [Clostridia bacterium]|nr:carbohydrate kinase family protein [Clostridia bacterium]
MSYSKQFKSKKEIIQSKKVSVGFDGFVDLLIRPVKTRDDEKNCTYFPTIDQFGEKITSLAGRSGNIELIITSTDFGGCGPHFANGLANMGIGVTCVGTMGYPDKNSVFALNENCKTISIGEPGYSYVFEFGDGKIIMSDIEKISQLRWNDLIERVSIEQLVDYFDDADIITLVNWSYLVHFHEIYEQFLETVMPKLSKKDRKIYVDIADCAKRAPEEIKRALKMFGRYSKYAPTYLGLNKSEAMVMHSVLCEGQYQGSLPIARAIKEYSGIGTVVIHPVDSSAAVFDGGEVEVKGILCENPKKTTGGGDNFNSGFCAGLLAGFDIKSCLISGMTTSYLYVKNGKCNSFDDISEAMKMYDNID